MNVLVTGATGYVGGRLIPRLLADGHRVRVLVRDAARIQLGSWAPRVEVHVGDVLNADSLRGATAGIDAAYYLARGLAGALYWYALYPLHRRIFSGLARAIARRAESGAPAV